MPREEPRRASLFGLGNGVLFVRACAPESPDALSAPRTHATDYPGTYLAGLYNHAQRHVNGQDVDITTLANLPNAFALSLRHEEGDSWFRLEDQDAAAWRHTLDMRTGTTRREVVLQDQQGRRLQIRETRFVSMARAGMAWLRWSVVPQGWSGTVQVQWGIALQPLNAKVPRIEAYQGRHLAVQAHTPLARRAGEAESGAESGAECGAVADPALAVVACTTDGRRRVRVSAQLMVGQPAFELQPPAAEGPSAPAREDRGAAPPSVDAPAARSCARLVLRDGEPAALDLAVRIEALDHADTDTSTDTRADANADADADAALREHVEAWASLWARIPFAAPGDQALERACRFNAFHLLQTASPLSIGRDTGFPARGWQEAYFGHIFWDELFAYPFFNLRLPEIGRALLEYRIRRLPAAREAARAAGLGGAMYPWRSAATGQEETPAFQWIPPAKRWRPDHTRLQRHIGAAIAFNVWQHHLATGDEDFLCARSGPMLVEIARFWACIAQEDPADGRWHICGVVGPDEYHDAYPGAEQPGLDDNAYTNVMAAWTLRCASQLPRHLSPGAWRRLCETVALEDGEAARWERIGRRLAVPMIHDGTVIAQFDGFDRLLAPDADPLPARDPAEREDWWLAAQGREVNEYQITKQADVLMLFHLLGRQGVEDLLRWMDVPLATGWHRATLAHYLVRVTHESSLSRVVCAGALADLDLGQSWHYYHQALHTDLGREASGSTHEGLHLGAMAGTWDVLQRLYLGLHLVPEGVHLRPRVPPALTRLAMDVVIRSARFSLALGEGRVTMTAIDGPTADIAVHHGGGVRRLAPGESLSVDAGG